MVINYSKRFTLSGMTGQFDAKTTAAIAKISGTDGPKTDNQITNPAAAVPAGGAGQFGIPYGSQSGNVYYAPMAKQAPSKITAKGNARVFPTSDYSVFFRTGMAPPNVGVTQTQPVTYVVQSMEPTIAAAGQPDDMQKFLNRWKD